MKSTLFLLTILYAAHSHSYKECEVTIESMYMGDNEAVWLYFEEGGSAVIRADNINQEKAFSIALAAQMANKKIRMRYHSDGVVCTTNGIDDFRGIWLIPNS